jgi:HEAT repeat protein
LKTLAAHVLLARVPDTPRILELLTATIHADSGGRRHAARVLMRCGAEGFAALLPLRHRFAQLYTELDSPETTQVILDMLRETRGNIARQLERKLLQELNRRGVNLRDVAIELLSAPEVSLRWRGAGFVDYARGDLTAVRDKALRLYQEDPTDYTWLQLLAKTGDRRATAPLLAELGKRMDELSRSLVLDSLGETGDPVAVDAIIPFLDHKSEMVRSSAAEALGKIGDARAIEPIRVRLRKESVHEKVRKCWKRQQRGETVSGAYFESLTKKASVQIDLATALVQLGAPEAQTEMLHCLPFEDDQQTYHGRSPLPGLAMLGPAVVPALIDVLENDDDPFARTMACIALGEGGHAALAVDALLPLLAYKDTHKHMEESVRGMAAGALGDAGDRRATIPLCEMLSDERWTIEYSVRNALEKLADPQAAPALVKHLTTLKRTVYNTDTLSALLACGRDAAFPLLTERFNTESDDDGRAAILFALAWLNDKRALPLLREPTPIASSEKTRTILELAVDYLEAAPDEWLKPQWEA